MYAWVSIVWNIKSLILAWVLFKDTRTYVVCGGSIQLAFAAGGNVRQFANALAAGYIVSEFNEMKISEDVSCISGVFSPFFVLGECATVSRSFRSSFYMLHKRFKRMVLNVTEVVSFAGGGRTYYYRSQFEAIRRRALDSHDPCYHVCFFQFLIFVSLGKKISNSLDLLWKFVIWSLALS